MTELARDLAARGATVVGIGGDDGASPRPAPCTCADRPCPRHWPRWARSSPPSSWSRRSRATSASTPTPRAAWPRSPAPIRQHRPTPRRRTAMSSKAEQILAGLGGADNVVEIEACITRLRTEVEDPSKVDQAALKAAGAHGVVASGQGRAGRRRPRGGQPRRRHRGPDVTQVLAPCAGRVLALAEVPDPVFAGEMVGPGVAVEPTGEVVTVGLPDRRAGWSSCTRTRSSCSATTASASSSTSASTPSGSRAGGSSCWSSEGDTVAAGDPIVRWDPAIGRGRDVDAGAGRGDGPADGSVAAPAADVVVATGDLLFERDRLPRCCGDSRGAGTRGRPHTAAPVGSAR